jgi:hypothetical protein
MKGLKIDAFEDTFDETPSSASDAGSYKIGAMRFSYQPTSPTGKI